VIRIATGFDLHKLVTGRPLILGGVNISYHKGLLAHSDGDVLIHSIIDALLSAANLPNIGELFPDHDPQYKNISSLILLQKVMESFSSSKIQILNLDNIILCEKPKLNPHILEMKHCLTPILNIKNEQLSIKPKTMEGIGVIGKEEAIAVLTTLLVDDKT
jgi:2-C-methyl-D-erythritol 2,4-cyclodiphosphate synthase